MRLVSNSSASQVIGPNGRALARYPRDGSNGQDAAEYATGDSNSEAERFTLTITSVRRMERPGSGRCNCPEASTLDSNSRPVRTTHRRVRLGPARIET